MIDVVAAVIKKNNKYLITQRNRNKHFAFHWEFPGGKVDKDESFEKALKREIHEELSININIIMKIASEKFKDEIINVNVHYFLCEKLDEDIILSEHEDMKWVLKKDLINFQLAPGDSKIVKHL
ncbi:MAG: NUDIX hydrolase [Rickettsiales bacterium]|nr:NUDIX hydrolase [Rickettsiales bacterium]|tara:strand:- start:65 stop:436 length:372 start_codon:yes stop_codon:yes gene_type:complete